MGRSADSKLEQADALDKRAEKLDKRDPDSARELRGIARARRRSAIKQLRRRPRRRRNQGVL